MALTKTEQLMPGAGQCRTRDPAAACVALTGLRWGQETVSVADARNLLDRAYKHH
jgi:hypothetical protein